ncbi:low affinity immunoglobulin gamma Fc region receptor II-like [Polypterus senegalus]|uniref:low affinity immunoglobulin gamma Fc region receptor II-like n=1 Tax=Polypterus senegalus TaxID=55291 RepID=UPI001965CCD3|nr:low affinity immunoglobulin gamma Fc region receptor II-like [Polypterus senegalus]
MKACDCYLLVWMISMPSLVNLTVKPNATLMLRTQKEPVYVGDTVALDCIIEDKNSGWTYSWYKQNPNQTGAHILQSAGHLYTFQPVTQTNSGMYRCDAQRNAPLRFTALSNTVTLTVQERRSRLDVISDHTNGRVLEGDWIILSCQVNGDPVKWRYELHRGKDENLYKTQLEENFTISPVTHSHHGEYRCRARKGEIYSSFSDPVWLHVSGTWFKIIALSTGICLAFLILLGLLYTYLKIKGLLHTVSWGNSAEKQLGDAV